MWDELLLAKPAQLTTCRKQTFHSFPTYLVFLTFSLQILERNALNYYAVLTSRKLKLKKLFRHLMYFFFFFFFARRPEYCLDHATNICIAFIWSITQVAVRMPDTITPENSSYCSFSSCFDVCQSIRCLQVPLFWQADPPDGLVLYSAAPRSAIIWAGVRLIFLLFMIMLWSCGIEITADLCLDATPRGLPCISMSPMKSYI